MPRVLKELRAWTPCAFALAVACSERFPPDHYVPPLFTSELKREINGTRKPLLP